jgi:hypothetical protein
MAFLLPGAGAAFEFRLFIQHVPGPLLTSLIQMLRCEGKIKQRADVYLSLGEDPLTGAKIRDVKTSFVRDKAEIVRELIEVKKTLATADFGGVGRPAPCHQLSKSLVRVERDGPYHRAFEEGPSVFVLKDRIQGDVGPISTEVTFLQARIDHAGKPSRWSAGWVSVNLEHPDRGVLEPFAIELARKVTANYSSSAGAGGGAVASLPGTVLFGSYPEWIAKIIKEA